MDPCGRRGTRSEDELRDRRWDRRVETRRCTQGKEKDLEGIRADEHRTRQCRKAMKTNAKAISAVLLVLLVAFFQAGKAYDDYYDDYGGGAKAPKKIAGVVDLDEITFDKIVDGSHNVFVSFVDGDSTAADDEDDEGDDEDSTDSDDDSSSDFSTELETLAEKFGKHNGVILARVDASDAFDITEKFDVNSYPTLMLFQKGEKTPERYEGVLNADKIEAFLGSKVGFPAVVEELEGIVKKFKSDESSRDKTLKEAREVVEGLDEEKKKLGEYYLKVMEKVMKKGNDHVSKEARRLSSIIEKGSALQDKITEMKQRLDILRSFHKDEL
eukprot:scaffold676_cov316-Pavlova_lutheri.AAC.18